MKISQEEALDLIKRAEDSIKTIPYYRFGQALWNIMSFDMNPKYATILEPLRGQDEDIFHVQDKGKVLEMFYEHYVE